MRELRELKSNLDGPDGIRTHDLLVRSQAHYPDSATGPQSECTIRALSLYTKTLGDIVSKKVYEYWYNKIKASEISDRNKQLILDFVKECSTRELSYARMRFYLAKLWVIIRLLNDKPLDGLSEEDVKNLVSEIRNNGYSDWTIYGYKVVVKQFFRWLKGYQLDWLKITMKNNHEKLPEEILTKDEVERMIANGNSSRDKAIVAVIYESGCRISEFLGIKLKHIQFDDYGCVIRVSGKTGSRRIRLVSSIPHLSTWLQNHPKRDDKDSFLWVGRIDHIVLDQSSIRRILNYIAKKAGITKPVNPHAFRHARATYLANYLTEAQMCEYLGWKLGSKMPRVYIHLSGRDVDKSILKMYGIVLDEEKKEESPIKECKFCHERNSVGSKYCKRCGASLDPKVVGEIQRRERELLSMISPEMIERMIEKKVEEALNK